MARAVRNVIDSLLGDAGAEAPALAEALAYLADTIDARDRELAELRDGLQALSNRLGSLTAMVGAHDTILSSDGSDADLLTRAEVRRLLAERPVGP